MILTQEQKIAGSILIGFALVAVSIFASGTQLSSVPLLNLLPFAFTQTGASSIERADKSSRIIYGDHNAPIKLVEFSDFQCPYCSQLHSVLKQIVDESGGTVQWEYRHFPLPIHPQASPAAHYGECVAQLSGNEAFWKFASVVMNDQSQLSDLFLQSSAHAVGVDLSKLTACISDPKVQTQINVDSQTAQSLGGSGTPFTVIVYPDGSTKPVAGALPYAKWKSLLNIKT